MNKIINIYLEQSDKARLANRRIRLVRDEGRREPQYDMDLVFVHDFKTNEIPDDAIYSWTFYSPQNDPIHFYTTAERCKEMVSPDPSYWTKEKLAAIAKIEEKLYTHWDRGEVYGYIVEEWDETQRKWKFIDRSWGMYGEKALFDNLPYKDGDIVCCAENLKYNFENVEMKVNSF